MRKVRWLLKENWIPIVVGILGRRLCISSAGL
jgi:hypothetical protein